MTVFKFLSDFVFFIFNPNPTFKGNRITRAYKSSKTDNFND